MNGILIPADRPSVAEFEAALVASGAKTFSEVVTMRKLVVWEAVVFADLVLRAKQAISVTNP